MRPEIGVSPHKTCINSHLVNPCIRHLGCVVRVSKRPDNSRPSDGIDESSYKELSPGAREVFKEVIARFDFISPTQLASAWTGQHQY
jgi:hypothetical protein